MALCGLGILLGALTLSVSAATTGYSYDADGRLAAVTDPDGTVHAYSYDQAGNLLSIALADLLVTNVSPSSGQAGTAVTLSGIGFAPGAPANTVKFNGTTAVVTSANATTIQTSVPTGATSGFITVTNGLGTATSLISFRITGGPPSIASFSPTKAAADALVQLVGTGYSEAAGENFVTLSGVAAAVTPSSDTDLSFAVPANTSSGKIGITTAEGSAVSTTDLLVPPPGFTAADLETGVRMSTYGTPVSLTISTTNKIGLILFEAAAGQRLSYDVTSAPGSNCASFRLVRPNNSFYTSDGCTGVFFRDGVSLDQGGTWALLIDPHTSLTGSWTVTFHDVPSDPSTAIDFVSVAGDTESLQTTTPGQATRFTFSGASGDRLSYVATTLDANALGCFYGHILRPDGSLLHNSGCIGDDTFVDIKTLDATGTWTILLDEANNNKLHNYQLSLYKVPADQPIAMSFVSGSGDTDTLVATTPGQDAYFSFSGTSGDRASFIGDITNPTSGACFRWELYRPNGTLFRADACTASSFFRDTQILDATGTWTVRGTDDGPVVHTYTLALYKVPFAPLPMSFVSGAGDTETLAATTLGEDLYTTFSGTSGDRVSFIGDITNPTSGTCFRWELYRPNGTLFNADACTASSFLRDTQILDATGTWTVRGSEEGRELHTYTLTLYKVPFAPLPMSFVSGAGDTETLAATTPGEDLYTTFSGTSGDRASFIGDITNPTSGTCFRWELYRPNGSLFRADACTASSFFHDTQILDATGTWTVRGSEEGRELHTYTLTLYKVPAELTVTVVPGGAAQTLTIDTPGQGARFTFDPGTNRTMDFTGEFLNEADCTNPDTATCMFWHVRRPNDTVLTQSGCVSSPFSPSPITLDGGGIWTIEANETNRDLHCYKLSVTVTP